MFLKVCDTLTVDVVDTVGTDEVGAKVTQCGAEIDVLGNELPP